MQAIDCIRDDRDGSLKAKRKIGATDVVINRFGDTDDLQTVIAPKITRR